MKKSLRVLVGLFSILLVVTCSKEEKSEKFELEVIVDPEESGTVSPSEGIFDSGEELKLTATPAKGYSFKSWNGTFSDSLNPINFKIASDIKLSAVFERLDDDKDGVFNDEDECPNTPSGESVDEKGCSDSELDTDGDGVSNDLDECPETTNGDSVDVKGCSLAQKDSDGDGITDDLDKCPGTVQGTTVNENGCTEGMLDGDLDGIANDSDLCPETPSNEEVDSSGCSLSQKDTDEDGVSDELDECPDTPKGNTVNEVGCSSSQQDSDDDGVSDDIDQCSETAVGEKVDDTGCSAGQKDSDADGINDSVDECPETLEGEVVDELGCSASQKDSDNDGVNDDLDECVETPSGEPVNEQGCSESQRDSDGDGVTDNLDECPDTLTGADVDEKGCLLDLKTYVPDDLFEQALIYRGYDDVLDDYVLKENIKDIEELDIGNVLTTINNLIGLEDFVSLKKLTLRHNFGSIEISGLKELQSLIIDGLSASSVTIVNNENLNNLYWIDGGSTSLQISNNPKIEGSLYFEDVFIKNFTISNEPNLQSFFCNTCGIDNIVLIDNLKFNDFDLDVGTAKERLQSLTLKGNSSFLSLSVTEYINLEVLSIQESFFSNLDVSNNLTLSELNVADNPLSCIKVSQEQLDNIPVGWVKDEADVYSLDCQ